MKHFRKVSAVLLAAVMLAVMLPSFLSFESAPVEAADVGAVTNGGFENGDGTGWSVSSYGVTIGTSSSYKRSGSYGCRLSKDESHNGNEFLTQVIPVNTNATYEFSFYVKSVKTDCDYVACFTYSLALGTAAGTCNTAVVTKATVNPGGTSWTKISYSVSTGSNKYLKIIFTGTGVGSGDCGLDDIALTATNAGDTGTHAAPALTSFGTRLNRPNSDSNNIVVQPGFEDTTNAQWNTTSFITGPVSRVTGDAEGAHSGNAYLKYYRGTVALDTWPEFTVSVPSAGEYVFSAWVRTPNLSSNNMGKASIGIINPDTGKFLTYAGDYYGHFSTDEIQIRSTATDDEWHLRSVTFYVGSGPANVRIGMYGLASTMYIDDISVHKLENGVEYTGNQHGSLSVSSTSVTNKYCESEDNLIADCNMSGQNAVDFWTKNASGWNNGFLEFGKDAQHTENGKVLHYKGANPGSNKLYNYIKWIYVEPNTEYTVSFDYRVVSAGNQLMFADNNIRSPQIFHTPSLGSASNSWSTYAFTFSTGNYNRIAVVFRDSASAETYFDDFRFFKTYGEDGNPIGLPDEPAEEVFPTLKHEHKGKSRSEMGTGYLGLGFRFYLDCTGVTVDADHKANYTAGKVDAFEDSGSYTLLKVGAVMTNQEAVGQDSDAFVRENVTADKTVIDIPAALLMNDPGAVESTIIYGVRVTNIPERHINTVIYVRPYYVFDYNGSEITVYGDVQYDSYEPMKDINDGWFEWD